MPKANLLDLATNIKTLTAYQRKSTVFQPRKIIIKKKNKIDLGLITHVSSKDLFTNHQLALDLSCLLHLDLLDSLEERNLDLDEGI